MLDNNNKYALEEKLLDFSLATGLVLPMLAFL